MAEDNRLDTRFTASGTESAEAAIGRITRQVESLRAALTQLNRSQASPAFTQALTGQLAQAEAALKRLSGQFVQSYRDVESFNIRAVAAMRGQADAIRGIARAQTEADAVHRARGGGNIFYQPQENINRRLGLDRAERSVSSGGNFTSSLRQRQAELNEAFGANTGAKLGTSFWSRFFGSGRLQMSLMDEGMRGQRGAMVSSLGAAFRRGGIGGAGSGALMGGIAVVGGAALILHEAEALGKWAEATRAAAAATGMSVQSYSKLQGALVLTGAKAESADAGMRMFANNLEKATANPAARSAKALHAIGISQAEIVQSGGDVRAMVGVVADRLATYAESANKAAVMEALFGRNAEAMAKVLENGNAGLKSAEDHATNLGIVLDDKTSAALVHTMEKVVALGQATEGSLVKAFVALAPSIDHAIDGLARFIGEIGSAIGAVNSFLAPLGGLSAAFEKLSSFGGFGMVKGIMAGDPMAVLRAATGFPSPPKAVNWRHPGSMTLRDVSVTAQGPYAESGVHEGSPIGYGAAAKGNVPAFDTPKGGGGRGANKEITSDIDALRKSLQGLKEDYHLAAEQQDALSEHQRIQTRIQQASKEISPTTRAKEDYTSFREAAAQKQAALSELQAKTDAVYDQIIAKAQEVYKQDPKLYKEAIQEKINADKEFLVQHQQMQNQVDAKQLEVVTAYANAVQQVIQKWGAAFDQIAEQIETTIGTAIKSAFEPMKPEYWWSSIQGPHGQPLMQSHRIDPTMQLASSLGFSVLGDLGKTIGSSISTALGKQLFGEGSASFGAGLAKMIGIGGEGGLFGTGLGAVSKVTSEVTFATAVGTFVAGVTAFVGATSAQVAAAGASAGASAAGAIGGVGSGLGFFGKLFAGTLFGAGGGIIPSAAGGWALPNIGGGIPLIAHAREMVLPAHISDGLQNMIRNGGSGDSHLHFHGPADAPSISRWFKDMMSSNPGVVRQFFRQNALTPRTL